MAKLFNWFYFEFPSALSQTPNKHFSWSVCIVVLQELSMKSSYSIRKIVKRESKLF